MNGKTHTPPNFGTNIQATKAPATGTPPNTCAVLQPTIMINALVHASSITAKVYFHDSAISLSQTIAALSPVPSTCVNIDWIIPPIPDRTPAPINPKISGVKTFENF